MQNHKFDYYEVTKPGHEPENQISNKGDLSQFLTPQRNIINFFRNFPELANTIIAVITNRQEAQKEVAVVIEDPAPQAQGLPEPKLLIEAKKTEAGLEVNLGYLFSKYVLNSEITETKAKEILDTYTDKYNLLLMAQANFNIRNECIISLKETKYYAKILGLELPQNNTGQELIDTFWLETIFNFIDEVIDQMKIAEKFILENIIKVVTSYEVDLKDAKKKIDRTWISDEIEILVEFKAAIRSYVSTMVEATSIPGVPVLKTMRLNDYQLIYPDGSIYNTNKVIRHFGTEVSKINGHFEWGYITPAGFTFFQNAITQYDQFYRGFQILSIDSSKNYDFDKANLAEGIKRKIKLYLKLFGINKEELHQQESDLGKLSFIISLVEEKIRLFIKRDLLNAVGLNQTFSEKQSAPLIEVIADTLSEFKAQELADGTTTFKRQPNIKYILFDITVLTQLNDFLDEEHFLIKEIDLE